ncbi:MAG: prephenate dehydrogenase [Terriglobia bacterium]
MIDLSFRRVAIAGVGLIGGSWGLALRRHGFRGVRVGCDRPEVLDRARALGAIDEGREKLSEALAGADLIILAAPVAAILRLLPEIKSSAGADALITDVGSTKRAICERAGEALGGTHLFLGGHPLAGKELSGIEHAEAALFENAAYTLTPQRGEDLDDPRALRFREILSAFGARVLVMDAAAHDEAVAWLSHLPQLLSTGLASLATERPSLPLALAASGFRDATRLAGSPYALWRDICSTNLDNIQYALDAMILKLQSVRDHLVDEGLESEFRQAQALRKALKSNRGERI